MRELMPEPQNSSGLSKQRAGSLGAVDRIAQIDLARILTSMLMGVLFFAVLTPIALAVRAAGRRPLELRIERNRPSYWRAKTSRAQQQTSMTKQY